MNERIKEFAKQCLSKDQFGLWLAGDADIEKFAELIVKECAQLARDTDLEDVEGGDQAVLRAAKKQILEHFGVE